MGEEEMRQVARLIAAVLHEPESEEVRARVTESVHELSARFPLYPRRLRERAADAGAAGAMGAD
jgi:hypothetical protein